MINNKGAAANATKTALDAVSRTNDALLDGVQDVANKAAILVTPETTEKPAIQEVGGKIRRENEQGK